MTEKKHTHTQELRMTSVDPAECITAWEIADMHPRDVARLGACAFAMVGDGLEISVGFGMTNYEGKAESVPLIMVKCADVTAVLSPLCAWQFAMTLPDICPTFEMWGEAVDAVVERAGIEHPQDTDEGKAFLARLSGLSDVRH